jgi:hypothetical protein
MGGENGWGRTGGGEGALPAITPPGMLDGNATTLLAVAEMNELRQTTTIYFNGR